MAIADDNSLDLKEYGETPLWVVRILEMICASVLHLLGPESGDSHFVRDV